jgi:hypothetical protein
MAAHPHIAVMAVKLVKTHIFDTLGNVFHRYILTRTVGIASRMKTRQAASDESTL